MKNIFNNLQTTLIVGLSLLFLNSCTDMSGDGIDTIIWEGSNNIESTSYHNPVWEPSLEGGTVVVTPTNMVALGAETQWAVDVDYCCPSIYSSSAMIWETNQQNCFNSSTRPKWVTSRINSVSADLCKVSTDDGLSSASRYIMVYSTEKDNAIGIASAASAQGPYTDHGCLLNASSIGATSLKDPFIISIDVNKTYIGYSTNNGSYVQRIDLPVSVNASNVISYNVSGMPTLNGDAVKVSSSSFENIALLQVSSDCYFIFGDVNDEIHYAMSSSITGPYKSENGDLETTNGSIFIKSGTEYKKPKNLMRVLKSSNGYYYAAYNAYQESNEEMPSGYERCPLFLSPFQIKNNVIDDVITPQVGWSNPKYVK
jgi:hypothetical protein